MKWEYRTDAISWAESKKKGLFTNKVDQEKIDAFLNERGDEGWEVAAVFENVQGPQPGTNSQLCFVMKRPK